MMQAFLENEENLQLNAKSDLDHTWGGEGFGSLPFLEDVANARFGHFGKEPIELEFDPNEGILLPFNLRNLLPRIMTRKTRNPFQRK
jgi:hypothetical protein